MPGWFLVSSSIPHPDCVKDKNQRDYSIIAAKWSREADEIRPLVSLAQVRFNSNCSCLPVSLSVCLFTDIITLCVLCYRCPWPTTCSETARNPPLISVLPWGTKPYKVSCWKHAPRELLMGSPIWLCPVSPDHNEAWRPSYRRNILVYCVKSDTKIKYIFTPFSWSLTHIW